MYDICCYDFSSDSVLTIVLTQLYVIETSCMW